jgi:tetratricopeptide (TPR) repeat protein
MAKAKKITQEELQAVQGAVNNINNLYMAVGRAMIAMMQNKEDLESLELALQAEQKSLEDKYGSITINLSTGEYEEAVQEAEVAE